MISVSDKIRNMSEGQLEELLKKAVMCGGLIRAEESSPQCRGCTDGFCCDIGKWLKSEYVKEEE